MKPNTKKLQEFCYAICHGINLREAFVGWCTLRCGSGNHLNITWKSLRYEAKAVKESLLIAGWIPSREPKILSSWMDAFQGGAQWWILSKWNAVSCSETVNVHFYNPRSRQALNKYGKTFVFEMYFWWQSPLTHAMMACRECRSKTSIHY